MAFMNIDDGIDNSAANEEAESSFQDESSSSDDEINSPELDKLYEPIACLSNSLTKSKERPRTLWKELKALKKEPTASPTSRIQKEDSYQVKKFEKTSWKTWENSSLKLQIVELRKSLDASHWAPSTSIWYLRTNESYSKARINYKLEQKEMTYMSLVARDTSFKCKMTTKDIAKSKIVKGWVSKQFIIKITRSKT